MLTIHKYPISLVDRPRIEMPRRSTILSVDDQHGQIVLWAQVDTDYPLVTRELLILGTGAPAQESNHLPFLGTVQSEGGALVWHVFDKGELG